MARIHYSDYEYRAEERIIIRTRSFISWDDHTNCYSSTREDQEGGRSNDSCKAACQEYLAATKATEKAWKKRNEAPNKAVQKYGEIYGYQARRQIAEDEEDERKVINMREKRLTDPWRKKYKEIIKDFPVVYRTLRDEGRFIFLASYKELLLPF